MKIRLINAGFFKLDGGAMFGIVPKNIWNKLNPSDDSNLCTWSMRTLLIEINGKKILIDTGIGSNQNQKFFDIYQPSNQFDFSVLSEEITDVFLTHLHFDHCGGAMVGNNPTFKNATYWSNEIHWNSAIHPNPKEKNSFLKENFIDLPISFIPHQEVDFQWLERISIRFNFGHTQAMMLLWIESDIGSLIYCADTIPSVSHIGLPYVMSYDIFPLTTITEKNQLLHEALEKNAILIFEHDPKYAACTVKRDPSGRIIPDQLFTEDEFNLLFLH
jgi:glyoxylase-like metal-dependent hydrolase (beta-lactamase superfamily II)